MDKILLVIPPFMENIYKDSKVKAGVPGSPFLSLATIGGALKHAGAEVKLIDLNFSKEPEKDLLKTVSDFRPGFAGFTFTTPLFNPVRELSKILKEKFPELVLIGGGPHASSMPEDTLKNSSLDIVVIGEGDFVIRDIILKKPLEQIQGIAYRAGDGIKTNKREDYIKDLNSLEFPAWELYELRNYRSPLFMVKKNPAGWLETSRGCPFDCCYCNKSVFGRNFRPKSTERVLKEIRRMLDMGFKEIHIADDMFTTDVTRVKEICRGILSSGLQFPWATVTGIRVDCGDQEMFDLMKQAGCYRVYFGIESGNQEILNAIGKGITLEQIRTTTAMARKAGLETCGFFIMGLPGETEKNLQETIDFACSLGLDWAKLSVMTPLPATRIYKQLEEKGRLKIKDWSKYNLYMPMNKLYEHENLDWETINKYFNAFYRAFYFRPAFVLKKLANGVKNATLLHDLKYFISTRW